MADEIKQTDKKVARKSQNQKAMIISTAIATIAAMKPDTDKGIYIAIFTIAALAALYVIIKSFLDYNEKDEE